MALFIPALFARAAVAQISAVVYDGVGDYLKHTSGPTGAANGRRFAFAVGLTKNSDGSAMTLVDIPGTAPLLLEIQSDNTVDLVVGTAGAISTCSTTATVLASDGPVLIVAQGYENRCFIDIKKASGFTASPADTPGTAADIDFTADWFLGADGGAGNFTDADVHFIWGHLDYIGGGDAEFAMQFMDDSGNFRDLGTDGSNPLGGQTQPILLHNSAAASHTANKGSGGDADEGTTFEDGTSPGVFAAARTNAFDLLLSSVAWWSADHKGNTITAGNVETLADRTSNGNDPTQATAGNRPALTTAGGLTYMDFDGAGDVLADASPTAAMMGNFDSGGTSAFVVKPDSDGENNNGRIFHKGTGLSSHYTRDELSGAVGYGFQFLMTGGAAWDESDTTNRYSFANPRIVGARHDKSTASAANIRGRVDGQDVAMTINQDGGTSSSTPTGTFYIGDRGASDRAYDGRIYEGAFWDSELSDANMARVDTHMANKYGITLS